MSYVPRLKDKYRNDIVPALMKKFNYDSVMQVPRLLKISVNQGVGDAVSDKKLIDSAVAEMSMITGQKAVATKSRKDIANFKLRAGVPVGVRVTLRETNMYEFL
ncbi:MAG TPA: 50S ribosomal protein L5, partial [Bacteroidia bacterium]|nr:50S ribosomal protein L5 [Bacteroidia bacterium]